MSNPSQMEQSKRQMMTMCHIARWYCLSASDHKPAVQFPLQFLLSQDPVLFFSMLLSLPSSPSIPGIPLLGNNHISAKARLGSKLTQESPLVGDIERTKGSPIRVGEKSGTPAAGPHREQVFVPLWERPCSPPGKTTEVLLQKVLLLSFSKL